MYILAIIGKRKNSKRHITSKTEDINTLRNLAKNINDCYHVEIYRGNWSLVEIIK